MTCTCIPLTTHKTEVFWAYNQEIFNLKSSFFKAFSLKFHLRSYGHFLTKWRSLLLNQLKIAAKHVRSKFPRDFKIMSKHSRAKKGEHVKNSIFIAWPKAFTVTILGRQSPLKISAHTNTR